MKKTISVIVVLFLTTFGFAQNTTRYSQLNFAQGVNNPAAIAIDGSMMVDMIFRNQWLGVEGAPTTVALNGQYEINETMATGLTMGYDRIGVNQTTSVGGQYAYRVHLENSRSVIFGLGLGIDNVVKHLAGTTTTQAGDPAFATSYSKVYFNGGFGVLFNGPQFYAGLSIPQLFQNTRTGPEAGLQLHRWHHYVTSGFYFHAGDNYTFNPHLQLKITPNAPLQGDIILRNTFINRFSLVVGYRSENSIIAGFDFLLKGHARVGYSFNYDVGSLSRVKGMSNELYLGLAFPYRSDREDFGTRRYTNRKGGSNSDYKRNSRRKHHRRGQRYGRNHKYR